MQARVSARESRLLLNLPVSMVTPRQAWTHRNGPSRGPTHATQAHPSAAPWQASGLSARCGYAEWPCVPVTVNQAFIDPRRPIFIISPIRSGRGGFADKTDAHLFHLRSPSSPARQRCRRVASPSSSPVMVRITAPSGGVSVTKSMAAATESRNPGLHVCRPSSIKHAVFDLGPERRHRPVVGIAKRHHIRMPVEPKAAGVSLVTPARKQVRHAAAIHTGAGKTGVFQQSLQHRQSTAFLGSHGGTAHKRGGQVNGIGLCHGMGPFVGVLHWLPPSAVRGKCGEKDAIWERPRALRRIT